MSSRDLALHLILSFSSNDQRAVSLTNLFQNMAHSSGFLRQSLGDASGSDAQAANLEAGGL